jgi:hypothetical protein
MIVWFVIALILLLAAFVLAPRKQPYVPTEEEVAIEKHQKHLLFIKDEKDTRRFYEDIRALYPL